MQMLINFMQINLLANNSRLIFITKFSLYRGFITYRVWTSWLLKHLFIQTLCSSHRWSRFVFRNVRVSQESCKTGILQRRHFNTSIESKRKGYRRLSIANSCHYTNHYLSNYCFSSLETIVAARLVLSTLFSHLLFIFVSIKNGSIGWHPRGSPTTRYHSNSNIKPPLIKMSEAGTHDGDNHNSSPVEFYSNVELEQMEVWINYINI